MATKVSRDELALRGRYSVSVAALFVLVLVAGALPLPRRAVVLVPLLVALVVSVREMRRLSRVSAPAVTRFGPVVAIGLSVLLLIGTVVQFAFYTPQKRYEDCMAGANTNAARTVCDQERQSSILGSLTQI